MFLSEIDTPRIVHLREKLAYMTSVVIWRPGIKHTAVEVFSRFHVAAPTLEDSEGKVDIEDHFKAAVGSMRRTINMLELADPRIKDLTLEQV